MKWLEVNVYNNAPWTRAPAQNRGSESMPVLPPAVPYPYGYYPLTYGPLAWFSSSPVGYQGHPQYAPAGYLPPALPPIGYTPAPPPAPKQTIEYPMILEWLEYCDRHPECRGEDLSSHA